MLKADKDDRAYISEPPRGGGWFFLVILGVFAVAAAAYFYLGKDKVLAFFRDTGRRRIEATVRAISKVGY